MHDVSIVNSFDDDDDDEDDYDNNNSCRNSPLEKIYTTDIPKLDLGISSAEPTRTNNFPTVYHYI
jgi:hypothetical protein